jgi:hypothetical protein
MIDYITAHNGLIVFDAKVIEPHAQRYATNITR